MLLPQSSESAKEESSGKTGPLYHTQWGVTDESGESAKEGSSGKTGPLFYTQWGVTDESGESAKEGSSGKTGPLCRQWGVRIGQKNVKTKMAGLDSDH